MVGQVAVADGRVCLVTEVGPVRLVSPGGAGGQAVVAVEVGSRDDEKRHGVGAGDGDSPVCLGHPACLDHRADLGLVLHPSLDAEEVGRLAAKDHQSVLDSHRRLALDAHEPTGARYAAGLIGAYANGDNLVRCTGEDLASEVRISNAIRRCRQARRQVQFATVVVRIVMPVEADTKVAQRLVLHLLDRVAEHSLAEEVVCLEVLPGEDQSADLGQRPVLNVPRLVVRPARPDGFLVELDAFLGHRPEDHRPDPPIPDRQGVVPRLGRLAVPQYRRAARVVQHY